MSKARVREAVLCATAFLTLNACSSVGRFEADAPHQVDMSGTWTLDREASDDPQKVLDKLHPLKGTDTVPIGLDDTVTTDAGQGGQGGGPRGGRRSQQQAPAQPTYRNNDAYTRAPVRRMLTADVARAGVLSIRQTPTSFSITYGATQRSFTPGARSVVSAEWGVADQGSGWRGKQYVIETKPQNGVPSTETYSLSPDGKHLTEQLHLGGAGFPTADLKRVYDRSDTPLLRTLPTND